MATQEARTLLDQLMGGDRNAPLPKGAALPGKHSSSTGTAGEIVLPGKRSKSCFDPDIDPLYTAWGVDVFDLFVNTKSDIGANPYIVDEGARQEYLQLPPAQQANLGFDHILFQKLSDLVRQCDRTITRNREKLRNEIQRKLAQRHDLAVDDVDEAAVEHLLRSVLAVEKLQDKIAVQQEKLAQAILEAQKSTTSTNEDSSSSTAETNIEAQINVQKAVAEMAAMVSLTAPQLDAVASERRQLDYVKSDISTDKSICEVSGNFMSARDADERIAAHYAGKQYVGWKLVRDKLAALQKQYGPYGPRRPGPNPPPPSSYPPRGGGYNNHDRGFRGRSGGFGDRGGGYHHRRGPPPPQSNYGGPRRW